MSTNTWIENTGPALGSQRPERVGLHHSKKKKKKTVQIVGLNQLLDRLSDRTHF